MILKKLHAIYLFSDNVKKSSAWYSNVLNTPLKIDEDNFGMLEVNGYEMCFHPSDQKSPASTGGSVGYWYVDSLMKAVNHFVESGGVIYRGPIEIPHSNEGICQIKDPFGNVMGLQGPLQPN